MQAKTYWVWMLVNATGKEHGYVQAVDPRDALARALTSQTSAGQMLGEQYQIPVAVLDAAPANLDTRYTLTTESLTLQVLKVTCPAEPRHPDDVVGCGSEHVCGPDAEGLFDCGHCGVFFNPRKAY